MTVYRGGVQPTPQQSHRKTISVVHIYESPHATQTLCGLPPVQHFCYTFNGKEGYPNAEHFKPNCPICGKPLCPLCVAIQTGTFSDV